ncbi:MAG: tRNA-dihydrouridine synthase, partial [Cyanobacteria bacterium P01_A01_bin.137]
MMQPVPLAQRLHPLSVAPMMDRTDRHFRYFMRQITRKTLLYTEMITSQAILHGDRNK